MQLATSELAKISFATAFKSESFPNSLSLIDDMGDLTVLDGSEADPQTIGALFKIYDSPKRDTSI
ncbi:hypothetical protein VDG1235_2577 [Verrucomicrobiia bacterium DG1235]|nr:hypothetical protein VDG1235_2577 [Verrucomicrobiae bacterium DG1235]